MSDSEEDDVDEEEEDEDEEDSEESGDDDDEEDEQKIAELKAAAVQEDLDILHDIFRYIDQTSRRITEKLRMDAEAEKGANRRDREAQILGGGRRDGAPQASEGPPISWDQYESLNDAERATLLERALTALAMDEGVNNNQPQNQKQAYYSYNR